MGSCSREDADKTYYTQDSGNRMFFGDTIAYWCNGDWSYRWGSDFTEFPNSNRLDYVCENTSNNSTQKIGLWKSQQDPAVLTHMDGNAGQRDRFLKDMGIDPKLIDDMNYKSIGWGGGPTGYYCGSGSVGNCQMLEPKETNKYACCTDSKKSTLSCGKNWCSSDSSNCDTYMLKYCSNSSNLITDGKCYAKYAESQAARIGTLCSKKENIRNPNCKQFCNNQVKKNGDQQSDCLTGANAYCAVEANKIKPECACINYKNSDAYNAYLKVYPNMATAANYQCWGEPCKKSTTWDETMTSYVGDCPSSLQICNQAMDLTGVTAASIGKVASTCNQSSVANTTNNKTTINNTQNTSSPDSSTTTTSAPDTSEAAPIDTSAAAPADTSSAAPADTSAATTPPSNNNTYMAAGGGGLFLICCCCCVVVAIIAMMMMMSKK